MIIIDKPRVYDNLFNLHSWYVGFFLGFLLLTHQDVPWFIVALNVMLVCYASNYVAIVLWDEFHE